MSKQAPDQPFVVWTTEVDVPLSKIEVNLDYQRPLRRDWVKRLTREFDEALFGKPRLAERDGRYYVVDGQHRVAAVKSLANGRDRLVRCDVQIVDTPEEEARLFHLLNTARAALKPHDVFRARLAAEDPDALSIVRILERYGYRVVLTASATKTPGTTVAFAALDKLHGSRPVGMTTSVGSGRDGGVGGGSPERLDRVLRVVQEAYGADVVLHARLLLCVDVFLLRYADHPDYDRARLAAALRSMDVVKGKEVAAVSLKLGMTQAGAGPIALALKYNGRRRTGRLPIRLSDDDADIIEEAAA